MGVCQSGTHTEDSKKTGRLIKGKCDLVLKVKATTWIRDSHGLFDYESDNVSKQNIKVRGGEYLITRENENELGVSKEGDEEVKNRAILKVEWSENGYLLTNSDPKKKTPKTAEREPSGPSELSEDNMWMVVKHMKHLNGGKGCKLAEGNCLKMGRVKFRVRELRGEKAQLRTEAECLNGAEREKHNLIAKENAERSLSYIESVQVERQPGTDPNLRACRICLSEGGELENPLVAPCDCSGTMKYVHINCLQQWLRSRVQTRKAGVVTTLVWKHFDCELCKRNLQETYAWEGKNYDLIEVPRPDASPYIIFEILSKDQNTSRGLHIVQMAQKPIIKLGRGHDCDIRIPDISVSRFHASIRHDKGEFFVEDHNSKFGTLLLSPNPMLLEAEFGEYTVQIGRSLLTFSTEREKKYTISASCFSNISVEKDETVANVALNLKKRGTGGEGSPNRRSGSPTGRNAGRDFIFPWNTIPGREVAFDGPLAQDNNRPVIPGQDDVIIPNERSSPPNHQGFGPRISGNPL
eukprot:TRINITY_DN7212_c0_g1_i3.p1 TRINITY_DN7212_c0_g1~~TRINITY_DN7212_c0_g1_i3.p1  ORF type:complete len:522 (+),score=97.84 TRINITY_DN7212_c0_g1_i3:156-1721(+)